MTEVVYETNDVICLDGDISFPITELLDIIKQKWGSDITLSDVYVGIDSIERNESWKDVISIKLKK